KCPVAVQRVFVLTTCSERSGKVFDCELEKLARWLAICVRTLSKRQILACPSRERGRKFRINHERHGQLANYLPHTVIVFSTSAFDFWDAGHRHICPYAACASHGVLAAEAIEAADEVVRDRRTP